MLVADNSTANHFYSNYSNQPESATLNERSRGEDEAGHKSEDAEEGVWLPAAVHGTEARLQRLLSASALRPRGGVET